ncbi:hypothetical protein VF21_10649 [Pseudogymnoascus sp. 05NY08]|nr:hypothetical protein VF21_10649 [Pseudogymnoascus sp. 05NY08]
MSVVSSKGKAPTTPTSSQRSKPENKEMPDAPAVNELRETLRVELYQYFNDDKFPTVESYALWTTSYLRGEALWWVEPFLKDYFLYENTCGSMVATQSMFGSWKGFRKEIRCMFSNIDEVKTAEDHLLRLKQTGSTLTYATEFQRYSNQTKWDTNALLSHYRRGLKNHVCQQDWGINGDSTPEEESSEEESEAESLTTSEQETYDELAPKESMNLQCEEIVKDMAKFAHAKIKKAREEPDGATLDAKRKVSMIKSIYKSSLYKVPRQVLAKD